MTLDLDALEAAARAALDDAEPKCVRAHDRCYELLSCPYCEPTATQMSIDAGTALAQIAPLRLALGLNPHPDATPIETVAARSME